MQQNRTILAVDSDNFTNIAIRYTQNAENAFLLAELNGMNVDDIIPSGTVIMLPAESETPSTIATKQITEVEPTPAALLELFKQHSGTVATTQQLGHVRSGSNIRVNADGTMEVIGGVVGQDGLSSILASTILLSNTVWVNLDLTENNTTSRIFKSWLDAKDWIVANTTFSETNLCQIMLPAGNVGNITLYEGIRLSVTDGTVIENLSSSVTFDGDYNTLFKAYLAGAQINNLDLQGDGKCCALYNCVVNNVVAATSSVVCLANDCQFLAGDFQNYEGVQSKCRYNPILGDIDNLKSTGGYNELQLVDGYAFELNCIDIFALHSIIYPTSVSGELMIENCSCGNVSLNAESKITNSAMGTITGTGTANITVKNSTMNDIILEDTATLTHENSTVGTATVAAGATLTRISEPYDNAISGLTATNVKDAIDELKALIDNL